MSRHDPDQKMKSIVKGVGPEIGHSLGIRRPYPLISGAVKSCEISVVETHSTTASCSTIQRQLRG